MILARDIVGVIGVDNTLPWDVPADMAIFKMVTKGKTIVMGRKTWDSLPKKPLPGRHNIIITSANRLIDVLGEDVTSDTINARVTITPSVEGAINIAKISGVEELVFIGGKSIYEQVINIVDEIHVCELNLIAPLPATGKATYYEQDFEELGFKEISYEEVFDDGHNVLDYIRYARPLNS